MSKEIVIIEQKKEATLKVSGFDNEIRITAINSDLRHIYVERSSIPALISALQELTKEK